MSTVGACPLSFFNKLGSGHGEVVRCLHNSEYEFLLSLDCMSSLSPLPFSLPSPFSLSFLIARDAAGRPVGFVNFRFDLDESIEVVYWYVNLLDIYMCVL